MLVDAGGEPDGGPARDEESTPVDTATETSEPGPCNEARIAVESDAAEVRVGDLLRLQLVGFEASDGREVNWLVRGPGDAIEVVFDSGWSASYLVRQPGPHAFAVETWTAEGALICRVEGERVDASELGVTGLVVVLSWRTPGDANENDTGGDQIYFSVGSDMDLHLLHPKAYGQYFDWTYDCYWDNVNPEWGIFGPGGNPTLDRDDADGVGPEQISLREPEHGVRYQIGVHYWNDWGYGPSIASVAIYVDGALVDQWDGVELTNDDMWDSHYFDSGSGAVSRIGAEPVITPNYRGFSGP